MNNANTVKNDAIELFRLAIAAIGRDDGEDGYIQRLSSMASVLDKAISNFRKHQNVVLKTVTLCGTLDLVENPAISKQGKNKGKELNLARIVLDADQGDPNRDYMLDTMWVDLSLPGGIELARRAEKLERQNVRVRVVKEQRVLLDASGNTYQVDNKLATRSYLLDIEDERD